jgi:protein-tyrosine phosphatase
MAEALLDRALWDRGVHADVRSAGRLRGGRATTAENEAVMGRRGIDLTGHRSTQATAAMVRDADLVLGMAREHVHDALDLAPAAFPRCFTLKEIVRRAEQVGPRLPTESLREWLDQVGAGRDRSELAGSSADDDVDDPIGQSEASYERVAAEVAALTTRLVDLAWPADDGSPPGAGAPATPEPLAWTDTD